MTDPSNPNEPTTQPASERKYQLEYVGFWARFAATLIDSILVIAVTLPITFAIYGKEYFLGAQLIKGFTDVAVNYLLPAIAILLFWMYRSATPGKMALGATIVDSMTGRPPTKGQLIGRYFAYYLSIIPLCLGFLWIAFDPRKRGWHDILAGTVVVREVIRSAKPVVFSNN